LAMRRFLTSVESLNRDDGGNWGFVLLVQLKHHAVALIQVHEPPAIADHFMAQTLPILEGTAINRSSQDSQFASSYLDYRCRQAGFTRIGSLDEAQRIVGEHDLHRCILQLIGKRSTGISALR
jgi:hypothetical protein